MNEFLKRRFPVSVFMLVVCTMAFGNDSGDKIFPYKYEMKELANGLRVIVVPTAYTNIVSLQIP